MRIDIMTLFPETLGDVLSESILGRAQERGYIRIETHQIRDYTANKQNQVDDYPYGGGMGMVMFPQPIADCFRAVCEQVGYRPHLIYMSPQGKTLTLITAIMYNTFQYKNEKGISGREAMALLSEFGVLEYLSEHWEILHTQSRQWIIEDIDEFIRTRKGE